MEIKSKLFWTVVIGYSSVAFHCRPAQAIGFTGNFAPDNWVFTFNDIAPDPPTAPSCDESLAGGCVEATGDAATLALAPSGADSFTASFATWTWTNKEEYGTTYYVTFDWEVVSDLESSSTASFSIANVNYGPFEDGTNNSPLISDVKVATGQSISFRVDINDINSGPIEFQITNFNAQVPAPLPAAGAATAFGYSRRLRRRIKGQPPAGSCPPVLPAHPSAYLNLAPSALKSVPLTFSYASRPAVPDHGQDAV